MLNTSAEPHTAPLYEFYSRSVAFIAAAATVILGQHLGLWSDYYGSVLVLCAVYPVTAFFIGRALPVKFQPLRRPTLLVFDSFLTGCFMAYMNFAIIPSVLFAILVNTSIITLGSFSLWFGCLIAMTGGAYFGYFAFSPPIILDVHPSIEMAALIGTAAHLAVTAFYSAKQTAQLAVLHTKLSIEQKRQQNLSHKVAKYISPQIWESIFSGNKEVRLETQRKKLVVFFSDIKGFTALSEQIESEALTELLNNYLTEMTNIALKYGGTIDKYIGDSIMVFFGDPKTQGAKKDTLACVAMAIEMRKHMKVLRQKWRAQGVQTPLEIRMGINTGYCTVGNFGTESRMDYTIIGKEVNMASRLESAADAGEILLSHESYALVQDKIICREKGTISAKGFSRPVPVYEVVDFRHNLGQKATFIEHDLPGFSMYIDTNRINNYDRAKIAKSLEIAANKIKSEAKMKG
ncbi:adenylate/guanylate cyclase domain-containing protein [Bermanella sp. R86510]|uniref:adenylate/guanylate cyclase domain-containing protein n=1 Tax=unclassified Bermanella TaxID=2627862 RepID=UPI0037C72861